MQLFVSGSSRAERTAPGHVADSSVLLNQNMLHVSEKTCGTFIDSWFCYFSALRSE